MKIIFYQWMLHLVASQFAFDHSANQAVPNDERWLEFGFFNLVQDAWTTARSTYLFFHDPVVFLSSPELPGNDPAFGKSVALRLKDITKLSIGNNMFPVEFKAKSQSVNTSTTCTNINNYYTPDEFILGSAFVGWMIVEKGLYSIGDAYFSVSSRDNVVRFNSNFQDLSNYMAVSAVTGCLDPAVTSRCEIPVVQSEYLYIGQLQTHRVQRFLSLRGATFETGEYAATNRTAYYILMPHDVATVEDDIVNHYIPDPGEDMASMIYTQGANINCKERFVIESGVQSVSSTALNTLYANSFVAAPGIFAFVMSINGIDPVLARAIAIEKSNVTFIIQEDKCRLPSASHVRSEQVSYLIVGNVLEIGVTTCSAVYSNGYPTASPSSLPTQSPVEIQTESPTTSLTIVLSKDVVVLSEPDQYDVIVNSQFVRVHMWGAGGAGSGAGNGAYVEGGLKLTPGQVLNVIVGEGGKPDRRSFGGGGVGGGGRSAIRYEGEDLVTAGGGGGGPYGGSASAYDRVNSTLQTVSYRGGNDAITTTCKLGGAEYPFGWCSRNPSVGCPQGYYFFGNYCYKYYESTVPWHTARDTCHNEGAWLVDVHSEDEARFLNAFARFDSNYWLGLNDGAQVGTWVWDGGSSIDYMNWDTELPSNSTLLERHCVLTGGYVDVPLWSTANCSSNSLTFVCKMNSASVDYDVQPEECLSSVTTAGTMIDGAAEFAVSCPNSFVFYAGSCYKLIDSSVSWLDAQLNCSMHGAWLADIHSADELRFLALLSQSEPFWIGYNRIEEEGEWKWDQGSEASYVNWWPRQPIGSARNCSISWGYFTDPVMWLDVPCEMSNKYICEAAPSPANQGLYTIFGGAGGEYTGGCAPVPAAVGSKYEGGSQENTCSIGYTPYGDSCYKFYSSKMTWYEARSVCHSEGAWLTDVQSEEENQFLHSFALEYPYFIGYNDIDSEGTWTWDGGKNSTYTNWLENEPSDYDVGEDCAVGNWVNSFWNNTACDYESNFVCKTNRCLSSGGGGGYFGGGSGGCGGGGGAGSSYLRNLQRFRGSDSASLQAGVCAGAYSKFFDACSQACGGGGGMNGCVVIEPIEEHTCEVDRCVVPTHTSELLRPVATSHRYPGFISGSRSTRFASQTTPSSTRDRSARSSMTSEGSHYRIIHNTTGEILTSTASPTLAPTRSEPLYGRTVVQDQKKRQQEEASKQ